jgi:hypothetical protein
MGGSSTTRPGPFIREKETLYPFYRKLGGPQGWSRWMRKISPSLGFDARIIQPVGSRYTDCAIPGHAVGQQPPKMEIKLFNSPQLHTETLTWQTPTQSKHRIQTCRSKENFAVFMDRFSLRRPNVFTWRGGSLGTDGGWRERESVLRWAPSC